MKHRSDIDGLRAIAVLPVLGFHAGIPYLSGGFVGVDVFFVISGYLISSIIIAEIDQQKFSIGNFYARRFRRIFPALVAMLIVTTLACSAILFPSRLMEYGRSLMAAILSLSNVYFFETSGYFDAPSSTKPLLHTWSLSVEEQFYLVLPPLLMLCRRFAPRRTPLLIATIAAASLASSVWGVYAAPTATFYLLPARAWELLLGTLLSLFTIRGPAVVREAASGIGLTMIIISVLFLKEGMHFPGLAAVPACVGTAMILWAGQDGRTAVARLLATPPLVGVGLISYSLYLWHWPIIVLYKQQTGVRELSPADMGLMIAVSMAVAVLSWRFVEQPFRKGDWPRLKVFGGAATAAVVLATAGAFVVAMQGLPGRFPPAVNRITSYLDYAENDQFRDGVCFISFGTKDRELNKQVCLHLKAGRRNILVLGDSHAAHLYYGIAKYLPQDHVLQATASGCKPTIVRLPQDTPRCAKIMNYVFNDYLEHNRPDLILISARWLKSDLNNVAKTLEWAKARGQPIALAGPIAEYDIALPFLVTKGLRTNDPNLPMKHLAPELDELDQEFAALAAREKVPYGSAYRALCNGDCKYLAADGAPLQFDYGHLTKEGSLFMAANFARAGVFGQRQPLDAHRQLYADGDAPPT